MLQTLMEGVVMTETVLTKTFGQHGLKKCVLLRTVAYCCVLLRTTCATDNFA